MLFSSQHLKTIVSKLKFLLLACVADNLTEGGLKTWAICLDCDRKKGRSLRGAWGSFGGFLIAILVVLAAAVALLAWLSSS